MVVWVLVGICEQLTLNICHNVFDFELVIEDLVCEIIQWNITWVDPSWRADIILIAKPEQVDDVVERQVLVGYFLHNLDVEELDELLPIALHVPVQRENIIKVTLDPLGVDMNSILDQSDICAGLFVCNLAAVHAPQHFLEILDLVFCHEVLVDSLYLLLSYPYLKFCNGHREFLETHLALNRARKIIQVIRQNNLTFAQGTECLHCNGFDIRRFLVDSFL